MATDHSLADHRVFAVEKREFQKDGSLKVIVFECVEFGWQLPFAASKVR